MKIKSPIHFVDEYRLLVSKEIIALMEDAAPGFVLTVRMDGTIYKFTYDDTRYILDDMVPVKKRGRLYFSVPNPLTYTNDPDFFADID